MKSIKEFKPLWNLVKEDKKKIVFASILVFVVEMACMFYGYYISSSMLQKVESKITRKLGLNTYCKALNMSAYGYEKTSSDEVINRITYDADTLSFAFLNILQLFSYL